MPQLVNSYGKRRVVRALTIQYTIDRLSLCLGKHFAFYCQDSSVSFQKTFAFHRKSLRDLILEIFFFPLVVVVVRSLELTEGGRGKKNEVSL